MKHGQNILKYDMDTSPKKKYLSPSIRLCKALSLECVMNEGPASVYGIGTGTQVIPDTDELDPELSKRRYYDNDFYSGYDNDY